MSTWFSITPADVTGLTGYVFMGIVVAMLVAGIVVRVMRQKHRNNRATYALLSRVGRLLLTMTILAAVLLFFSYENIRLFGARFWYVIWLVVTIIWAAWIVRFAVRDLPAREAKERERLERQKYLPKSAK